MQETTSLNLVCATCGGQVPAGAFCALCGSALVQAEPVTESPPRPGDILPTQRVGHDAGPPANPPAITTGRVGSEFRGSSRATKSLAVIAVVTVLGGWAFALSRPERHTVTGYLSLNDSAFESMSPGDHCNGSGGYDDITAGAQVVLTNESGKTLQTGELGSGVYDGVTCDFPIRLPNVPPASFYRVAVGNSLRGDLQMSQAEMKRNHWQVALSLGDGS